MSETPTAGPSPTSTQPYLLRALHEWCCDNGLTPHIVVRVDHSVQVPPEFVRGGEVVLNVSYDATSKLHIGNDYVRFTARFGGRAREVIVPVGRVTAIYARETGQGMAFAPEEGHAAPPPPAPAAAAPSGSEAGGARLVSLPPGGGGDAPPPPQPPPPPTGGAPRPALRRVK